MTLVVAAFGQRLVVAAPGGPGEDVVTRGKGPPDHAPEEPPDLGDGERDQLGDVADGDVSRPAD